LAAQFCGPLGAEAMKAVYALLTGGTSPYHALLPVFPIVEDDQKSLTLQNWSTGTKAEFCKTEGKGLYYPVIEAGVWVDCVSQRNVWAG
jgi:hypothetical protein